MEDTIRIVVMGGSFNPPTTAHLKLMLGAVQAIDAAKGIFVPSNHDYVYAKMRKQKRKKEVLSEQDRLAMLNFMCESDAHLATDAYEYEIGKKARTLETMEAIQAKNPGASLYFILGADKLEVISRWHKYEEFLTRFKILVVAREDFSPEAMIAENPFLNKHRDAFSFMKTPEGIEDVSSSQVRELLRNGDRGASDYLHPDVWKMLVERGWFKEDITRFREAYDYLSNFYEAPVEYEGITYGSNEAAFQAQKCMTQAEKQTFAELRPGMAKKVGRQVSLRPDWEDVKLGIMEELVRAKFTQNLDLKEKLLSTGERKILEGNSWHDTFWGVDEKSWQGENHLGKILMKVRGELRMLRGG